MLNGTLDTLTKIMIRFPTDPQAAFASFLAVAQREAVDLRDLRLVLQDASPDVDAKIRRYEEAMRAAYPDLAKLSDENKRLLGEISRQTRLIGQLQRDLDKRDRIEATRDEIKGMKAEVTKLQRETERIKGEEIADHPMIKLLREALVYLAPMAFKAPMSDDDLNQAVAEGYPDMTTEEFLIRLGVDQFAPIPIWLAIMLRAARPVPLRQKIKRGKSKAKHT